MRFLVCYVDPKSNRERLGSSHEFFMEYASVSNVIRYGLAKEGLKPGSYNIYLAPPGIYEYRFICNAYKRVDMSAEWRSNRKTSAE